MDQIRYSRDAGFGTVNENLFVFDGVVLEIFGLTSSPAGAPLSQRFHRDLMTITIDDPDRKGKRKVAINAGALGACKFEIAEQDRPVIDFLERVRATLPAA